AVAGAPWAAAAGLVAAAGAVVGAPWAAGLAGFGASVGFAGAVVGVAAGEQAARAPAPASAASPARNRRRDALRLGSIKRVLPSRFSRAVVRPPLLSPRAGATRAGSAAQNDGPRTVQGVRCGDWPPA